MTLSAANTTERTLPAAVNGDAAAPCEGLFTIGPYVVLEEIGHGGMGVVYKAQHRELSRLVALKVLSAGLLSRTDAVPRFRAEARALARLRHPNIVGLFEIGEWTSHASQQPLLYFVLELVSGGGLDKSLRQVSLSPLVSARLVELLAGAVHHAHLRGVIHRDLKPGNVLLESRDPDPDDPSLLALPHGTVVPKITDYGLALLTDERERLTVNGELLGTPNYMAPEQVSSGDIGPPTDVYGLGAILYELLSGQPPFPGSNAYDVLYRIRTEAAPLPSSKRSGVPAGLEAVCMKCLQKDPSDRYMTARELADDLARFRRGERVRAAIPRSDRKPFRRGIGLVLGISLVALLIWQVLRSGHTGTTQVAPNTELAATSVPATTVTAVPPLLAMQPSSNLLPAPVHEIIPVPRLFFEHALLRTLTFRNGENGYLDTQDTEIRDTAQGDSRNKNYADAESCRVFKSSGRSGASESHALVRFDNLFGNRPGQVMPGADIQDATLNLYVYSRGDKMLLRRMLGPWNEREATWNSLKLYSNTKGGVQPDGIEAAIDGMPVSGSAADPRQINVLDDVRHWANGEPNFGWAILPTGAGVSWWSAENEDVERRPQLVIRFRPPTNRPRAIGEWYAVSADKPLKCGAEQGVLANDLALPPGSDCVVADRPSKGRITLNLDGSFLYEPEHGYVGRDSFMYKIRHQGQILDTATVHFVITKD